MLGCRSSCLFRDDSKTAWLTYRSPGRAERLRQIPYLFLLVAGVYLGCVGGPPRAFSAEPTREVVVENLATPLAATVQPGTNHLFVALGDGNVVRILEGKLEAVVTGLAEAPKPMTPVSLKFVGPTTLAIGASDLESGACELVITDVPDPTKNPVRADQATRIQLPNGSSSRLQVTSKSILTSGRGDQMQAVVAQLPIQKADLLDHVQGYGQLRPVLALRPPYANPNGPLALATTPTDELLIGSTYSEEAGAGDQHPFSQISFYRMTDWRHLMSLRIEMSHLIDLGYSSGRPDQRLLYALGASSDNKTGLFLIQAHYDGRQQHAGIVKIAAVDRPTSLAIGSGGIYVAERGAGPQDGRLLKFTWKR